MVFGPDGSEPGLAKAWLSLAKACQMLAKGLSVKGLPRRRELIGSSSGYVEYLPDLSGYVESFWFPLFGLRREFLAT